MQKAASMELLQSSTKGRKRYSPKPHHRKVFRLTKVALASNPWKNPPKPKYSRLKKGLKYEKDAFRFVASQVCAKKLGKVEILSGQWLEFLDWNGKGFACPDFYFVLSDRVVLFEAKLTATPNADNQMSQLYVPLLEKLYALPVVSCAIYRNGSADCCNTNMVKSFKDLLNISLEGEIPSSSWHFTPFR